MLTAEKLVDALLGAGWTTSPGPDLILAQTETRVPGAKWIALCQGVDDLDQVDVCLFNAAGETVAEGLDLLGAGDLGAGTFSVGSETKHLFTLMGGEFFVMDSNEVELDSWAINLNL